MRGAAILLALTTAAAGAPAQALPRTSLVQTGAPAPVLPRAAAMAQCAPLGVALDVLAKRYGERVFWWGQTGDDVTMIITERPDTRTWTLLAVHDGEACMVGSGGTPEALGS